MGGRSLFAVVEYIHMHHPYYSILQLDPVYPDEIKVDEKVRLNRPKEPRDLSILRWLFSPPKGSSVDLYMVPNWMFQKGDTVKPSCGYKFNFSDGGSFLPIKLPKYYKEHACVVSLRGKIYLSSKDYSSFNYSGGQTDFQCYDTVEDSWKLLEPFPCYYSGYMMLTALGGDTILLNGGCSGIWAYDVMGNKWYPVQFADNDDRCQSIVRKIAGTEAVAVGNTIYALTDRSVVVLSIEKNPIKNEGVGGNGLEFKCSLLLDKKLDPICSDNDEATERSRHLVHLGKKKFCVVQSCNMYGMDCQPIQVTYLKSMKDNPLMVMSEYTHWTNIQQHYEPTYVGHDRFCVRHCFSVPKEGAATASKLGKCFNLHPYPKKDYASNPVQEGGIVTLHKDGLHATSELENDSSQTNIIDEQGHSISVRNLPPNATVGQLEKGLKKFGPIKREGT